MLDIVTSPYFLFFLRSSTYPPAMNIQTLEGDLSSCIRRDSQDAAARVCRL